MNKEITLEIACNNYASCENAFNAGAHRIELFESIGDGGCTPSYGMMKAVKQNFDIPVYVMIRPRGGDFCYSDEEIGIMKSDIELCHQLNIDGIVFGILDKEGKVNKRQCSSLLQAWNNKPATFHRALERTDNIFEAAADIVTLGFERILTSGGEKNVDLGRDNLKMLQQQFGDKITIMPGAGITALNALEIATYCGVTEIHATAKELTFTESIRGNFKDEYSISGNSQIKSILNRFMQG
jgi:copper homeostasis protein